MTAAVGWWYTPDGMKKLTPEEIQAHRVRRRGAAYRRRTGGNLRLPALPPAKPAAAPEEPPDVEETEARKGDRAIAAAIKARVMARRRP